MNRTRAFFTYLLAILMTLAGVWHLVKPQTYVQIMPPYIPFHLELVYVSGFIEIALGGLLLVPRVSRLAAWGLFALFIAVFPANIYLYQHQELFPAPPILHLLRLPLQAVLLLWAYCLTRPQTGARGERQGARETPHP
jgi:uncharacterized membrane protein